MIKKIAFVFISFSLLIGLYSYCQKGDEYQVYALNIHDGKISSSKLVAGANPKDSLRVTYVLAPER